MFWLLQNDVSSYTYEKELAPMQQKEGRMVIFPMSSRVLSTSAGVFREEFLRASVSIKLQRNEEACFQKHPKRVHAHFNENPSMRAVAKMLRTRALI